MLNKVLTYIENTGLVILSMLLPIKPLIITVGFLIFLDLISGVWSSVKQGKKITSAALSRTVSKLFLYNMSIVGGYFIEKHFLEGAIPAARIVASVIGMVEFKSFLENTNVILGIDITKEIIARLSSKNVGSKSKKKKKKPL